MAFLYAIQQAATYVVFIRKGKNSYMVVNFSLFILQGEVMYN